MWNIFAIAAILLLPLGVLFLCKHVPLCRTVGAVTMCYAVGLLLSVLPLPYDKGITQTVASVTVALAIPLILFGFDVLSVRRLAKATALGMLFQFLAVVCAATAMLFVGRAWLGLGEAASLSGMAMGLYTGGTPNLVAVGNALLPTDARASTILAANTADLIIGGIYFFLALTVLRPVYRRLLGEERKTERHSDVSPEATDIAGFRDEYDYSLFKNDKKSLLKLGGVVLLAAGCLGLGALLEILCTGSMDGSLFIMVTVSLLGLAFSFVPAVRRVEGSYQVGQYLILVFSLGLSMSLDLSLLVRELLPTLVFFAATQILTVLVHLLLCKLFRIGGGAALITSIAGIYGPPFIAPVASAYGDRSLLIGGVICAVFGLAVGNIVGIGLGSVLSLL